VQKAKARSEGGAKEGKKAMGFSKWQDKKTLPAKWWQEWIRPLFTGRLTFVRFAVFGCKYPVA
jgi:hypothetical protein